MTDAMHAMSVGPDQEVHVVPDLSSDDTQHVLKPTCWCQPAIEDQPPDWRVVVHRRYMDGPVYEKEA